jgi:hypothetical protein
VSASPACQGAGHESAGTVAGGLAAERLKALDQVISWTDALRGVREARTQTATAA